MNNMLQKKIDAICKNIETYGLYRYDPRDISDFASTYKNKNIRSLMSVLLQLGEIINPIWVRNLLGVKKRLFPTTYTFLAESQFLMDNKLNIEDDVRLMKQCMNEYYKGDGYWQYKENKAYFPITCNKKPSLPLYFLCRCNNLLNRMGKKYGSKDMIDVSDSSAQYMLRMHIISKYDGMESISYYYNSDECTINVNTEVLDWLTQLSSTMDTEKYVQHIVSILKMVLEEQNIDGSWDYVSKFTRKKHGLKPMVDCHHTATTLYNLIHVYESGIFIDQNLREELFLSINKGMRFFLYNFFDKNGNGKTLLGRNRKASTMQYAETVLLPAI